jgi:hypothetical protein
MKQKVKILILILSLSFMSGFSFPRDPMIIENPLQKTGIDKDHDVKKIEIINPVDKVSFVEKSIPWIIALIIGILSTITNIFISNRLNKTSKSNIEKQLDNAKEVAITQFKSTLHTQNMQNWSDELRNCLSEFLSISAFIRAKLADVSGLDDKQIFDEIKDDFKNLNKYKVKILTLLNIKNPEEKVIGEKIVELMRKGFVSKEEFSATEHIELENKLLADSRKLFQSHWEKIKDLTN